MTFAEKRNESFKRFNANKESTAARCNADIEKYRKGDFKIVLKDTDGKPVSAKKIEIKQKGHAFKYGANIFMLDEFKEGFENKAYRDMFAKHFNLATVPFYWDGLESVKGKPRYSADSEKVYRRPAPDLCVEYCLEKGILPKLHCLFYDKFIPTWLPRHDKEEMRRLYEKRFKEIAERYCGKMYEFEVTNETLCYKDLPKKSVLSHEKNNTEWCFELAKKYFPNETLVINEGSFVPVIAEEEYAASYILLLEKLLQKGTPINKIGLQNHNFTAVHLPAGGVADFEEIKLQADRYLDPEKYFKALDMLSQFGLPLEITEVTIPTLEDSPEAEELQADILEELYTIWFSIPNMESVVYWNTVDNTAWNDPDGIWNENNCRGGLFHRDLTPKKSAERLYYLFNEKWHTDLEAQTDSLGNCEFRGFYGEYEAVIDGEIYSFELHKNSDNLLTITL